MSKINTVQIEFERLLQRSNEFENAIFTHLDTYEFKVDERGELVLGLCSLAFEHAEALRRLVAAGHLTSGMALLRLQYEALVRALWVLYVASEADIAKLIAPLTHESAQKASNAQASIAEMLKDIDTKGPTGLFRHLNEFRDYSWRPLNSYVHSGIHAVKRHTEGFPTHLVLTAIKQSNNLAQMTLMALAELSGNREIQLGVMGLYREYPDCLQLSPM